MKVLTTVSQMLALDHNTRRGAVFTMGALHQGHAQLVRECRQKIGSDGLLVVTIFVNPAQFGDLADLERYPRTLDADVALCESLGVDVVFAPSVEEMLPADMPRFFAGELGTILEGKSRLGHFDAVATIVHRLMVITQPDVTCFGEKDYQQLAVVRQMSVQAGFDVEIVGVATVRESDGLAMSSRNVHLSVEERRIAAVIPRAIEAATEAAAHGANAATAAALVALAMEPTLVVDYCEIRSLDLQSPPRVGEARILIAVTVGSVRLIDNAPLQLGAAA